MHNGHGASPRTTCMYSAPPINARQMMPSRTRKRFSRLRYNVLSLIPLPFEMLSCWRFGPCPGARRNGQGYPCNHCPRILILKHNGPIDRDNHRLPATTQPASRHTEAFACWKVGDQSDHVIDDSVPRPGNRVNTLPPGNAFWTKRWRDFAKTGTAKNILLYI